MAMADDAVIIEERTIPSTIQNNGTFRIPIKVYKPATTQSQSSSIKIKATVFFIHGGIFALGNRDDHPTIATGLAKLGLVVVTASFRNGSEAPHTTGIAMKDLQDVVDFVRGEWSGVPFGLVGSSSGGFFALKLSQTLGPSIISFCIPICPVANPYKRASYLRSCIAGTAKDDGYNPASYHTVEQASFILDKQLSFWETDEAMIEAGNSLKTKRHDIPTLMILGSIDKNVPCAVTADVQSWVTRTIVVGGKGHELCDTVVMDENDVGGGYHCYLPDIDRFLEYCLQ